jgi:penicillin-binding protein 1A
MVKTEKRHIIIGISIALIIIFSSGIGVALGMALGETKNLRNMEGMESDNLKLPSQVLDRDGKRITEFFSEEKREIVTIEELPHHLVYALLTREDRNFYGHRGISLWYTARAAWNILLQKITGGRLGYFSGGSTITQQVAKMVYLDPNDISIKRKLKEYWLAFQLERQYSKDEILELYLNKMPFGHNTYGVETASQFYFGHSAREITLAESVILVIQLSSPGGNSPIRYPERARTRQREILNQMVNLGYTTREEADASYSQFWAEYDYTRSNTTTAFFAREDEAPWFSEYVRMQLDQMLAGTINFYTDGLIIHTTLDLDYQKIADEVMRDGYAKINATYRKLTNNQLQKADEEIVPLMDMLALLFDMEGFKVADLSGQKDAQDNFKDVLNPLVDLTSLMFGSESNALRQFSQNVYKKKAAELERTTVEGALISIDPETGHILSMVGGSKFEEGNQYNRAMQARVQPGSSIKPLYYSAAIDSREFTTASIIYDTPVIFWNDDNTPYKPQNYKGEWEGRVLFRRALIRSMNVPSLKILDYIGFDRAIDRIGALLDIPKSEYVRRNIVKRYPIGLGVISVAPVEMAKAFSVFANQGKEVEPIAVTYITDRSGKIILEPEKNLRQEQASRNLQVISPQTAYIMVDLLKSTVYDGGTLTVAADSVGGLDDGISMAGKTGTVQNWSDIWTVGFSPYMTTAIWFGFDKAGSSLGVYQTGGGTVGPIWAKYMKKAHEDLPPKEFIKPHTGLVEAEVSAETGLLPPPDYSRPTIEEIFLEGTVPQQYCEIDSKEDEEKSKFIDKIKNDLLVFDFFDSDEKDIPDFTEPAFDFDIDTETSDDQESKNPWLD